MTQKPPSTSSTRALTRIEREFERIGLLLQHDAELPSFTALFAGEPIRGSWWSHALAHPIYDLLQQFADRTGKLSAKIVNGKVTYVHPRLWPAFLVCVQNLDPQRTQGLSGPAQALRERLLAAPSTLGTDELRKSGFAETKQLTRAIRELELRLLIHTEQMHTDSGAHAKVLMTWATWAAQHKMAAPKLTLAAANAELDGAVARLCANAPRRPRVAW
jgi:hypothetical protein